MTGNIYCCGASTLGNWLSDDDGYSAHFCFAESPVCGNFTFKAAVLQHWQVLEHEEQA